MTITVNENITALRRQRAPQNTTNAANPVQASLLPTHAKRAPVGLLIDLSQRCVAVGIQHVDTRTECQWSRIIGTGKTRKTVSFSISMVYTSAYTRRVIGLVVKTPAWRHGGTVIGSIPSWDT